MSTCAEWPDFQDKSGYFRTFKTSFKLQELKNFETSQKREERMRKAGISDCCIRSSSRSSLGWCSISQGSQKH